jgi:Metal-dependent hydrolases of the beta-lactamase superfamily I
MAFWRAAHRLRSSCLTLNKNAMLRYYNHKMGNAREKAESMSRQTLHFTLLGTGTSTGVPMLGCDCEVCRSTDARNRRTRCSALLRWGGHSLLIDTPPDLRCQMLREKVTGVDAVLYTHAHADHVHGIDDLRSFTMRTRQAIPIYGSPKTIGQLRRTFRYIFNGEANPASRPMLQAWALGGPFTLFGLAITPVPLQHGDGEAWGYRFGPFAYLTDCSAIPEASRALLQDLDVLVLDGLRFRSHPTHFSIDQAVAAARQLGARRTLLTHLCHEVEHGRDSRALPAGVELAYDGQNVTCSHAARCLEPLSAHAFSEPGLSL